MFSLCRFFYGRLSTFPHFWIFRVQVVSGRKFNLRLRLFFFLRSWYEADLHSAASHGRGFKPDVASENNKASLKGKKTLCLLWNCHKIPLRAEKQRKKTKRWCSAGSKKSCEENDASRWLESRLRLTHTHTHCGQVFEKKEINWLGFRPNTLLISRCLFWMPRIAL